jgi:hypothetical protein
MSPADEQEVQCPYCWELVVLEVDASAGSQTYTEDCPVCCQPMLVRLAVADGGGYDLEVERENS